MESALGASRGARVSCPLFRNKEMGSSSNPRCKMGSMKFSFNDPSHKKYHAGAMKVYCEKTDKLEKKNLKNLSDLHGGSLSDKRRMKLLKSVSKNLLVLSVSFSQDADKSLLEDDALQVLMTQLEQEKAEYKQRKKAMKAEKKAIKAQKKLQNKCEDESSSCDSTSSECEAFMTKIPEPPLITGEIPEPPLITGDSITAILMEENCSNTSGLYGEFAEGDKGVRMRGVEVCMGGKCKKLGAEQLLAAFEERINISGMGCGVQAVGCKCMGKCRNALNVRLHSDFSQELHKGVGIADVGFVLDHHFGVTQPKDEFGSKNVVCV